MSTKYLVYGTKRKTVHDIAWFQTAIIQDVQESKVEDVKRKIGAEVIYVCLVDTEEEADQLKDEYMLQVAKEYIPFGAEALTLQTSRPVLVYITNKEGSNLVSYPGFYYVRPEDYQPLQSIVDIRLATTADIITESRGILVVEDLQPFKELNLSCLYCVANSTKLPQYKELHKYILTWESLNVHTFITACKAHHGVLTGDQLTKYKKRVTRMYFFNDTEFFTKMYDAHLALQQQEPEDSVHLHFLFPEQEYQPELVIPGKILGKYVDAKV